MRGFGDELTIDEQVDKTFTKVGGCGLFQVFAYLALTMGMSAPSWYIYEIGFLTQQPDYTCTYTDGIIPTEDICIKAYICDDDPRIAGYQVDYDSQKTLDNWV